MAHMLYKIYYRGSSGEDILVYLGRTNQPLQNRLRGHLFSKPMHRKLEIEQISRIEYAEFKTAADMNLYEIYYILMLKPPLNVDDKTRDDLTVTLPDVQFQPFQPPLWEKWRQQLREQRDREEAARHSIEDTQLQMKIVRMQYRMGNITEEERNERLEKLDKEIERIVFCRSH